ncbi:MAG: hypothetical protein LYZ69_08490 [Nitrososphaerales archaeon]|nr:hypothetical protein [Nitrososphaerales archaeon]
MELGVSIERSADPGSLPFTEVFRGFEGVAAVRSIFGQQTDDILSALEVEIMETRGYLRINAEKGSVIVNSKYLREGHERHLYLDVIHELVHIRQHREGKQLWDDRYKYVDRPTEIEAYGVAVAEARRIGLTDAELVEYLEVEWVPDEDFARFLATLGVRG